jgi:methionyl-tRNA formyltransferase
MSWRALIAGSAAPVAAAVIQAWIGAGNSVAAFWHASPPGYVRRDRRLSWLVPRWSVSALARAHRFPIRRVPRLATWPEAVSAAEATGADVLISVFFRYRLPGEVLDLFGSRAVNFHPAPLPRYRGPNPIVAMVLDRSILTDGGMTLHILNEAFDEGPIVASEPVALSSNLDIARYQLGLAQAAARLTAGALQRYLVGEIVSVPQDHSQATYARPPATSWCLGRDMTTDTVRWQCRTLARQRPLKIAGIDSATATGFRAVLGPPSGEPPTVGVLSVAFDAADARVSVWRKMPATSRIRRLRRLADLARTPVC